MIVIYVKYSPPEKKKLVVLFNMESEVKNLERKGVGRFRYLLLVCVSFSFCNAVRDKEITNK